MSDEEKLQKAKEVADRLSGDVIEFEVNGQKYLYYKGLAQNSAVFERKCKEQLVDETGDPIFLL